MSAPRSRSLATASGLTLALALATPAAAFAGTEDPSGNERSQQAQAENAERKASPSPSPAAPAGAQSESRPAEGKSSKPKGSGATPATGKKSGQGANGEGRAAGGDPRGNNGTVKVHELGNTRPGNQPHVGCEFQIDFYGFDAGDTATITFTGHAPTGGGLLHQETGTVISKDAAGGGQDHDETLVYSVSQQLSELLAVAPHSQQGWHVKLAVDVDGAPGGAKQKVFWISCAPAPAVSGTTEQPATGGTAEQPATSGTELTTGTLGGAEVAAAPLAPTFGEGTIEVPTPGALAGTTLSAAQGQTGVTGGRTAATAVSAQGTNPQALPFTGVQGLLGLVALGLGALGAGGLAHRLGQKGAPAAS